MLILAENKHNISSITDSDVSAPAPLSISEVEEISDHRVGNVGGGGDSRDPGEELDIQEFSWDGLVIKDEDEEAM